MFTRTMLFYLILGLWTMFLGIICLPLLVLPSIYLNSPIKLWIKGIFFLLKHICKITHEIQGKEHIPKEATLIVSKHQSAFETFALFYYLPNSIFIHKKQLFFIPIFGQYLKKLNMISINRNGKASTIRMMLKQTKDKIKSGYSIIIFPEGTRKKPGDAPDYKRGVVGIYNELNTDVLPIAVNSGKYWPKNKIIKSSGNIIIKILPIIKSNINKNFILTEIQNKIEEATNQII